MYCHKCGAEIPDSANFCPQCKANCKKSKSALAGNLLIVIGILLIVIAIMMFVIFLILSKGSNNSKNSSSISSSVSVSVEASVDTSVAKNEDSDENSSILDIIKDINDSEPVKEPEYSAKSDKLQLPSLASYSEGRLTACEVEEDARTGGYSIVYSAGSDTAIVECLAEYADMLINEYGFSDAGSSSYMNSKDYNCLYRAFNTTDYNLDAIDVTVNNNKVTCNICFIKAIKDGDAYIKIYFPENVIFFYDEEIHKRNGY